MNQDISPPDQSPQQASAPSPVSPADNRALWSTFARAIDAELRPARSIRGLAGFDHDVEAIAVDDARKRVVIVSAEPSARMAALMQVDVQATMTDAKVIVARPVAFDLPDILRRTIQPLGLTEIDIEKAREWLLAQRGNGPELDGRMESLGITEALSSRFSVAEAMPLLPQLLGFLTQAERLPWREIIQIFGDTASRGSLDLSSLLATDSLADDLKAGVCPLPLFEFDAEALDLFRRGDDLDAARDHLRMLGIHQYFFPPRDQLVLGLVDQGLRDGASIARAGDAAPRLGHPLARGEMVDDAGTFVETLSALREAGYTAEGEMGIELSPSGRTVRSTIRVQPREGIFAKLLNKLSISVSPLDLLK